MSLLEEQYKDDSNLRARIDLHARFSTHGGWLEWLFEREAPSPGARMLEIGCGPAGMWEANLDRIDPSWSLTLTDFSQGMIDVARGVLGDRATYVVCDAQDLPFADESFDVVVANHMLYHVPDRPRAYGEIRRVLIRGGVFHASTNGHGHMKQLADLVPGWTFSRHTEDFGLETGAEQLAAFFDDVHVERHEDGLAVTEAEPVLGYIRSSQSYLGGDLEPAVVAVNGAIERDGVFRVEKHAGLITCRKA
ncbi:MAG: class I SAM-dependent methyltransferase [Gaiellaceae bacterium]